MNYIDHIQDALWVEPLVAEHGLEMVLRECVDVLADRHPDEVHSTATLLRDIGIYGIMNAELVARVRELMPEAVLPALRLLLRAPAVSLRMTAIYTIGKLTFPSEAKALRAVFPRYLNGDPVCLPRLLSELEWLGDRRGAAFRLKRAMAHENYLMRWSVVGCLPGSNREWLEIETRFLNELARTRKADYSLADIDAFVRTLEYSAG